VRAVWWVEVGPPSVLVPGDAPDPIAGPEQVLIRVEAAGITFIETQTRAGRAPRATLTPPAILGNGVGGTTPDGRRVVASLGGSGGYAALAVAAVGDVIGVPDEVSITDATALLADGRTALGLHQIAAPKPGETVLVEAAAGGVGSLLVQLAVAAGATVIAAASGSGGRKLAVARDLGASATVDYTTPGWASTLPPVDLAYDGVGGSIGAASLGALAPGGRFVIHGVASGSMTDTSARSDVTVLGFGELMKLGQRHRELSAEALALAATGRLHPVIGQTYPLERAADAHAAIEDRRSIGKSLLLTDPDRPR
jgi:NADPH2:quinone reductase